MECIRRPRVLIVAGVESPDGCGLFVEGGHADRQTDRSGQVLMAFHGRAGKRRGCSASTSTLMAKVRFDTKQLAADLGESSERGTCRCEPPGQGVKNLAYPVFGRKRDTPLLDDQHRSFRKIDQAPVPR